MTFDLSLDQKRIVDLVVDRVWHAIPGYSAEHISQAELRRYVEGNIGLATTVLARGYGPARDEFGHAIELGATRSLQGIPLDSVIRAFRVDERAILDELLRHMSQLGTESMRQSVDLLVTTFDLLTQECITSYRQASDEIVLHHEQLERDLVGDLALGEETDAAHVEQQARLLGAEPGRPHRAIALLNPAAGDVPAMLRIRRHVLSNLADMIEGRVLFGAISSTGLLLVPGDRHDSDILAALNRALHQRTLPDIAVAGMGTLAPGLRFVARSCNQALATAEVLARRGNARVAARWSDVVVDAALLQDRHLSDHLIETRIGTLKDQEHLAETLRAFLDCNLSQAETARRLFVHINTVAYRIKRIHDLTGKDPRRLADATELALALRAADLFAPPPGT